MESLLMRYWFGKREGGAWQSYGSVLLIAVWMYFWFAVNNISGSVVQKIKQPPAPVEVALQEPEPEPIPEPEQKEEPKKASEKSNSLTGERGESIKIDATYEGRDQVFSWLLERGARILILDTQGYVMAEIDRQGEMQMAQGEVGKGKLRQAPAEITAFARSPLPPKSKYAVVWWPENLWNQISSALKAYEAQSANISYRIVNNVLLMKIYKIVTDKGIINPNKTVSIK